MYLNAIWPAVWVSITAIAAANDVVTLLLGDEDVTGVGRVIGTDGPLTTYAVHCDPSITWGNCAAPFTIAAGESMWQMVYTQGDHIVSEGCSVVGGSSMNCNIMQFAAGSRMLVTTAMDLPAGMPVTITGTDIVGSTTKTADSAAATSNPTISSGSSAEQTVSPTSASDASATTNTPASSTSDNAAWAPSTGSSHWVVGGVAMALALAA